MQVRGAGAHGAAGGGAERHNGFSRKLIAFQKGADDFRGLPMPDRVAKKYHVVLPRIHSLTGNSGAGGWVVLLPAGTAGGVAVIQIGSGVGNLRNDFIKLGFRQSGLEMPGNSLRAAGTGKIRDQGFSPDGGGIRLTGRFYSDGSL